MSGTSKTSWTPNRARFPDPIRRQVLQRDPTCTCTGCRHHNEPCTDRSTEADHIIPIAEHGTNTADNGAGLCAPCHQCKTIDEALRARRRITASRRRAPTPHPGILP